jgi:uncharacterized protein (DUF1800 family)
MALATDREKCAHLLRRFGLGASEAELEYYLRSGLSGAAERLLDFERVEEAPVLDIEALRNRKNNVVPMPAVVNWWTLRLLTTRRPLQEKLTLFWHDHFATSASKVKGPLMMLDQNETLRRNAVGNFRTLLTEVSKDPAMLYWLDNQENVAGKPNENFAREVMELFTLGIGHYSEKDVQEAARAFTGWSLRRNGKMRRTSAEFLFRPLRHDAKEKTVLGKTGNLSGEDVLNLLCDHPRTAEYLVTKLWEWFVYTKPEPALVTRLARTYREANLDTKALLRAMMTSREFYSAKAERAVAKNPVDFVVTTLRQLGVGEAVAQQISTVGESVPRPVIGPAIGATLTMKNMGMWLMYPPDVAGWDGGQAWITSATMVERIAWADRLFGTGQGARNPIRYPAYRLFEADPTPAGVVKRLTALFDAPLRPERTKILLAAGQKASGGTVTPQNANQTAAAVSRLIFAAPEFQFA